MRIALLSCFHPFRGGISQFNASLFEELGKTHDVRAFNFTRQYPDFLFPGKTQYVSQDDEAVPVESTALLDTANPFNWGPTARTIRAWEPELLLMRYWMPYFAPSLGSVARKLRGRCKAVSILDNVIPHEEHWFDKPLTRYFLRSCDGFVVMADSVERDLLALRPDAPHILQPHPLYTHFGEKLPREEAQRRLGLVPERKTLLFFGLIRAYKGLDILLEAFRQLPEDYQLVIAGEPYGSFDAYQALIDACPGKERIHVFPKYIRDSEVRDYFSAADVTVLPYRSATQSGISSVSYHFDVPMIVTGVGGLTSTIGERGTGLVVDAVSPEAVRDGILRYFSDAALRESCVQQIRCEKERLSWARFGEALVSFAGTL